MTWWTRRQQKVVPPNNTSFSNWENAYREAAWRAALTGRRYRVWREDAYWWSIAELSTRWLERQ